MNITTRPAQQPDLPAVAELFDLYRQFYEQAPNRALALDFVTQRFTRHESVILVAENPQGTLVGFCQLYPSFCSVEAQPIFVLYDLFVTETARIHGAGRLLLQAAEAHAARTGKARMDLTTAKTNLKAQRLYEATGWTRDEVFFAYNRWVKADTTANAEGGEFSGYPTR